MEQALTIPKFLRQSSKLIMTDTSEYYSHLQSIYNNAHNEDSPYDLTSLTRCFDL